MSYQKLDLIQGSPEWLSKRFEHFTASRAGVVDNIYPYQTALEYAIELQTKQAKEEEGKEFLFAHGHAVEKAGREWVRSQLNLDLLPQVVVSDKLRCLLASLDGMDEQKGIVFEAKYVGRDALEDVKRGKLKPHHEYQIQAQMLATGFDKAIYFAMDKDGNAAVFDAVKDPDLQARLMEGITKFWTDLEAGKLPEPCDRDVLKVEDAGMAHLAKLYREYQLAKRAYESLEEEILARYSAANRVQGEGVSITKYWARGNVDWAALAKAKRIPTEEQERFRKQGAMKTKVTIK